jgi:hypothetical protein
MRGGTPRPNVVTDIPEKEPRTLDIDASRVDVHRLVTGTASFVAASAFAQTLTAGNPAA